jgi:hypothetical protein
VSDYGLDGRAIGVRSPAGAKDFSSNLCVQIGSEAHPASCAMGTGGPFPGAKRGRGVTLTTHPHLVPWSGMSRSYTSTPPSDCVARSGTALLYLYVKGDVTDKWCYRDPLSIFGRNFLITCMTISISISRTTLFPWSQLIIPK